MSIVQTIVAFFVMVVITLYITNLARVKTKRKLKWKIPREQMHPIMDETFRIFVCYILVIALIGIEIIVLNQIFSNSQTLMWVKYISILYAGILIIIMCYGEFDYKQQKMVYAFCINDPSRVKTRKSVLYFLIALVAIVNSYFKYANIENNIFKLINDTYLVCLIAVDRIINQIYEILKEKRRMQILPAIKNKVAGIFFS